MLTFEQVLEIFKDYLEMDAEVEVLLTKRGYLRIVWPGNFPFCDDGKLCRTPEDIRLVKAQCGSYLENDGRRKRNEAAVKDVGRAGGGPLGAGGSGAGAFAGCKLRPAGFHTVPVKAVASFHMGAGRFSYLARY